MDNKTTFDRKKLTSLSKTTLVAASPFWQSDRPVLWLAAQDSVTNPKHFYSDVAEALDLPYLKELTVHINDKRSVAALIGPALLSKWLFYPFINDNKIILACPDPFAAKEMIAICREHAKTDLPIVVQMASLQTVRNAISESEYQVSQVNAESSLDRELPRFSSKGILSRTFRLWLAIAVVLFLITFFWNPPVGFLLFFIAINAVYFVLNPLRLFVYVGSFRVKLSAIPKKRLDALRDEELQIYTILVPTKNEAVMVPSLLANLRKIDYPADKLDIKLIVEVTDHDTIEAFAQEGVDDSETADATHTMFHLVKVPTSELSTKPRSCNYALQFARGRVTVIYDAEDRPDPLQLKTAYVTFLESKLNTLCVQAKLNFYNTKENILTRFFTLEYNFWYDFFLPGLTSWHIPLPLGGTSNHFLTETLRTIGGWDPYNVTEDADIGWRLSRLGYRTTMIQSYTLEEANNETWNWIRQRTRWQKGFLLTTMVHLRRPVQLYKELGIYGFLSSSTLFLTNFLLPVLNPILWIFTILWYVPLLFGGQPIGFEMPEWVHTMGFINLLIGNGIYMLIYAIATVAKRQWSLLPFIPFLPLYWLLISIAAYRSIYQALTSPYAWEKTRHGKTA